MDIGATFTLGAVLGAGWMNSIGQAKKDVSLFGRMADALNAKAINMPVAVDPAKMAAAKKAMADALNQQRTLEGAKPEKGATAEAKDKWAAGMRENKKAVAAARAELTKLNDAQDKYTAAAAKSGTAATTFDRQAAALAKMASNMTRLSSASANFKNSFGSAMATLRTGALQLTGFVVAQTAFVGSVAKEGERVKNVSSSLGMGVMQYQDFAYAAKRAGVEGAQVDAGLRKLNQTIGQAGVGQGEAVAAFSRLGLNFQTLSAMPMEDKLAAIADRMALVGNETQRAYLAQTLFGRGGGQMAEVLKGGGKDLKGKMQYARDNSYTMDDGEVAKSREFSQALEDAKQAFLGIKTGVGLSLMKPLGNVLKEIGAFVNAHSKGIAKFFEDVGTRAAAMLRSIFRVVAGVATLVGAFLKLPGVLTALVAGFTAFAAATAAIRVGALVRDAYALAASFVRAVPALLASVPALWSYVAGTNAATVSTKLWAAAQWFSRGGAWASLAGGIANVRQYVTSANIAKAADLSWLAVKRQLALVRVAGGGGAGILPMLKGIATLAAGAIVPALVALKAGAIAAFTAIAAVGWPVIAVVAAIAAVAALVYTYWEPISDFFVGFANDLAGYFAPVVESLKEIWADLVATVEPLIPILKIIGVVLLAPFIVAGIAILAVFKVLVWVFSLLLRLGLTLIRVVLLPFKLLGQAIGAIFDGLLAAWNALLSILPDWLTGGKKEITVTDKTKNAEEKNEGRRDPAAAVGTARPGATFNPASASATALSAPVALALPGSFMPSPLHPPLGGLPPGLGDPANPAAASFMVPPISAPPSEPAPVFNMHNEITIHATPAQTAADIGKVVLAELERGYKRFVGATLRDATAPSI
jgi:hypothetical protein